MIPVLVACTLGDKDSGVPVECPGLDCRDELTLTILSPDGSPSDGFTGNATIEGGAASFSCFGSASTQERAACGEDGVLRLYLYATTVYLGVAEGDDAPYWSGELTPSWTAPYDSDECGHYCYLAEERITLLPCEGCG